MQSSERGKQAGMNVTKVARVSGCVAAGLFGIAGLMTGTGLLATILSASFVFSVVKAVILTPSYFMEGLRGTPAPSVNHSVGLDAEVGRREDE
jgi:hypothetical protein